MGIECAFSNRWMSGDQPVRYEYQPSC